MAIRFEPGDLAYAGTAAGRGCPCRRYRRHQRRRSQANLFDRNDRNPHSQHLCRRGQTHLPHAPVTTEVLRAAVNELLESGVPTADNSCFSMAYQRWCEPYNAGEAGIFTIALNEILDVIEQAAAGHGYAPSPGTLPGRSCCRRVGKMNRG